MKRGLDGEVGVQGGVQVVNGQAEPWRNEQERVEGVGVPLGRGYGRFGSCDRRRLGGLLVPDLDTLGDGLCGSGDEPRALEHDDVAVHAEVLTLVLEPEVLSQQVQKLALPQWRRLVPHAHLAGALREDAELALLRLGPAAELAEQVQRLGLVRHMVRELRARVDVERRGEAPIPLVPEALVVALDLGILRRRVAAAGEASDLLFVPAAGAAEGDLGGAGRGFVAGCTRCLVFHPSTL